MNRISTTRIIGAGVIAGTLDIVAACLQYFLRTGKGPEGVLRFVASGLLGMKAFTGGKAYIAAGLLIHFCIAISFAFIFYLLVKHIAAMRGNRLVTGIAYGVFVWVVMNLLVLPLTQAPPLKRSFSSEIQAMGILILCIGIPLAFLLMNRQRKPKLVL
jgi:uncharacterized membrane protein YagU involved in acid resistance